MSDSLTSTYGFRLRRVRINHPPINTTVEKEKRVMVKTAKYIADHGNIVIEILKDLEGCLSVEEISPEEIEIKSGYITRAPNNSPIYRWKSPNVILDIYIYTGDFHMTITLCEESPVTTEDLVTLKAQIEKHTKIEVSTLYYVYKINGDPDSLTDTSPKSLVF